MAIIVKKEESIADKAVSAIAIVSSIEREMQGINDYGEVTGFCDEQDQLVNDFHALLGSLRARASRLQSRLRKHAEKKAST
jgi:hypothetical protein